jgi:hypothetical protein
MSEPSDNSELGGISFIGIPGATGTRGGSTPSVRERDFNREITRKDTKFSIQGIQTAFGCSRFRALSRNFAVRFPL